MAALYHCLIQKPTLKPRGSHMSHSSLPEQFRDGASVVDATDGTSEEFGDGENGHVGDTFVFGQWNGVGDNNFFDG